MKIFGFRIWDRVVDLHVAYLAAMAEELRPDGVCCWAFDFPRRPSENHAALTAVIADVVRLPDSDQGMGFTHDMKSEITQRPAMRDA